METDRCNRYSCTGQKKIADTCIRICLICCQLLVCYLLYYLYNILSIIFSGIDPFEGLNIGYHVGAAVGTSFGILAAFTIIVNIIHAKFVKGRIPQ